MRLSQLLSVMEKEDSILVFSHNTGINESLIYSGEVKGIHKENPLNKAHIHYIGAVNDELIIEVKQDD